MNKKIPTFDFLHPDLGFALECPHCKEGYLHQKRALHYQRTEDAETGLFVRVEAEDDDTGKPEVQIDTDLKGNPSPRREATVLHFECENCSIISDLSFIQHKGAVYVNFD